MIYEAIKVQQNLSLMPQNYEDTEKMTAQAKSLGVEDTQTVSGSGKTEDAAVQQKQTVFDTSSDKNGKDKIEKPFEQEKTENRDGFQGKVPQCQCETCRRRRYQDDSDDNGVSCQMPTKMDPVAASFKVKAHEMEHVRREQMKAKEEGDTVISQSVRIMTDRCEECGTTYVSGGYTRTVTKPDFSDVRVLLAPYSDEKLIGRA